MSEDIQEQPTDETPVYDVGSEVEDRLAYALRLLAHAEGMDLGGRRYTTVPERVSIFRRAFGPQSLIETEITYVDREVVRARAEVHIPYMDGRVKVATGHAEEVRDAHEVNMVAALENAETSAIGRALAAFGIGGSEFATAQEVLLAKAQQEEERKKKGTEFLEPKEVEEAVKSINACKSLDELAETYLKLSPALKVSTRAVMGVKQNALKSVQAPQEALPDALLIKAEAKAPEQKRASKSAA